MNKISRPLVFALIAVLVLAVLGTIMATGPFSTGDGPTLMFFDEDFSDSAFGWMIAIPILILVGLATMAILAGAAVFTIGMLAFAAVIVVLALLLAFTPFLIFLAMPVLAIYGLVKLVQRDQRRVTSAV